VLFIRLTGIRGRVGAACVLVTSGLLVALATAPGSAAASGGATVTEHVAQAGPTPQHTGDRTGNLSVTVPVVGFAPGDGLPAKLVGGNSYVTTVLVVVGPGYDGATAWVTWDGVRLDGCRSVPLATGRANRLTCTVNASARSSGADRDLVVTVRTPHAGSFRHAYHHT
jgi:hypothetical protein